MQFLLDENMPVGAAAVLQDLGHRADHINSVGLKEAPEPAVLAYVQEHRYDFLLTADKMRKGNDRTAALEAMLAGVRIIVVPGRTLAVIEDAIRSRLSIIEEAFGDHPSFRRALVDANLRVRYETETDIRLRYGQRH